MKRVWLVQETALRDPVVEVEGGIRSVKERLKGWDCLGEEAERRRGEENETISSSGGEEKEVSKPKRSYNFCFG